MKKSLIFILCALVALVTLSCSKKDSNEPDEPQVVNNQDVQKVTFNVAPFQQTTEPLGAPAVRKAPIYDGEGTEATNALTDLFIFDDTVKILHQKNTDPDFGTAELTLTHGQHNLSVIMTRSTGISVDTGVIAMTSIRPTFGKLVPINVTKNTGNQAITVDRLTGLFSVTINDVFPTTANEIEFVIDPKYNQLDVTTLQGVNGGEWSQRVSCASKVGQSGVEYHFNTILPSLTSETTADVTLNIYDAKGKVIYSVKIEGVRMASNTKTLLSGNLFTGTGTTIVVNTTWNQDIVGDF